MRRGRNKSLGRNKVDPVSEPDKTTTTTSRVRLKSSRIAPGCVGVGRERARQRREEKRRDRDGVDDGGAQMHLEHGNCFGRPLKAQTNYKWRWPRLKGLKRE